MELQGKVVNDRAAVPSRSLGFFLDLIFASFSKVFADATPESLVLPLSSIPHAARQCISSYKIHSGSKSVELYDRENRRWRWNLPLTDPVPEQPASNATPGPAEPSDIDLESLSAERQVALFFNSISEAFTANRAQAGHDVPHRRQWLSNWSKTSLPASTAYPHMPDLVLIDNSAVSHDEITWLSPKVIAEYTKETFQPASRIGNTMDTKARLVLVDQPWRRFVLGLSIANSELRVHFYDHSGGAI